MESIASWSELRYFFHGCTGLNKIWCKCECQQCQALINVYKRSTAHVHEGLQRHDIFLSHSMQEKQKAILLPMSLATLEGLFKYL